MSQKISTDELKTKIATEVKKIGLHDVLDDAAIEKIKNKVMSVYNVDKAKSEVPDMIPEAAEPSPVNPTAQAIFPNSGFGTGEPTGRTTMDDVTSVEKVHIPFDGTQTPGQNIDAGTTGNIPSYVPELPSFMDKIEPAKIIIFSQNEISEGGENLSNKPLRTFADPDVKKSMNDFWLDKGQKKAEVYMVTLEKIGELDFNYANGTTQFREQRFDPDFEAQAKYKENPYMNAGPATPGALDINGQSNIVNQIAGSVDIEKVVTDIVMNILRNQLLTNTTKAVEAIPNTTQNIQQGVREMSPDEPFGFSVAQSVKPMEESFKTKMIDLVNNFNKIDSPKELREAIEKNDKTFLIKENEEVQEWNINGKFYYTPINKISTRKCYINSNKTV